MTPILHLALAENLDPLLGTLNECALSETREVQRARGKAAREQSGRAATSA